MSQPLPVGNFRWVEDCRALAESIVNHPADNPEGYILEVDLEYPAELHTAHNAYPLAPERLVVPKRWMGEFQHGLLATGAAGTEVEKLVPNLRNQERYVIHYRNLQLYLSLGMRLSKICRALSFRKSPWMEGQGVKKATVKTHIRHEQYKEALFEKRTFRHGMDILRSERHHIYGQHLNKVSLSPFDS
ncbi:hypothetical protein QZH41_000530 [Actinostola sp. cb2023]|nr:hypothetical protein QZH41_000530 [Actinostola sp. cb2023]